MELHELIQLQALKLKQSVTRSVPDQVLDKLLESDSQGKARQVCAMVSPQLFDDLERICQMLDISKRRFVEGALVDALDKAKQIVAQVDPFEHAEHQQEGA